MKKGLMLLVVLVLLISLAACSTATVQTTAQVVDGQAASTTSESVSSDPTATVDAAESVSEAVVDKSDTHEDPDDYIWDSSTVIPIILNGDSITAGGNGVTINGSQVVISRAGTYSLSGSLQDGQIVVETDDNEIVRLILNGVDLNNTTTAPILITKAEKVFIWMAENTDNTVSDGSEYVFASPEVDEPNAAIFSTADLTLAGSGSLVVEGNFNDGIVSKDGLIIAGATISVTAQDDGIRGKDYAVIKDGAITIQAQGDGLKADNEEDPTRGFISIEGGSLDINVGGDAVTAQTNVMVSSGTLNLISGGGSSSQSAGTTSAKGIKAVAGIHIDGGTFTIDSADDALNSNGSLVINGGIFEITSGDDGLHADSTLEINNGDIQITDSYEGIESAVISFNGGEIQVVSSDDGINVAGGNDGSGMNPGGRPGRGAGFGQDTFTYTGNYFLYVNGGYIVVDSGGDGLDINGAIEMTGGTVLVNGPTEQNNAALDYDGSFYISGGYFLAVGSSGMAQAPSSSSTQVSVLLNFNTQQAGTLVNIQGSNGRNILTFSPSKDFQSVSFSSPELSSGETYAVLFGGSSTGTSTDGLFQGGAYSDGTQFTTFTIADMVTMIGASRKP